MLQETASSKKFEERLRRIEMVRKWGDVNTDGLLEESCQVFEDPSIDGFVGYNQDSSNAVVFGDPVCSPQDSANLALAFQKYCRSKKLGVVYTIVSKEFNQWAQENLSAISIEFGEKFILDPTDNPVNHRGHNGVLVRKKVKHATKLGVIAEEYLGGDPKIEKQIENVAVAWLAKRRGPQFYLSEVNLFKNRLGKRWFYATHNEQIVGILILNQLQAKNGWLLNNVMSVKNAPSGLSELLVVTALQKLEQENCHYVLAGPAPADQLGTINGLGNITTALARLLYWGALSIFHLHGYATFWKKFEPQSESSFVVFPEKNLGYFSLKSFFHAYNVDKG